MHYGPISCDVELDGFGKRFGTLRLVHSDNVHAFSLFPIPIAVIQGSDGPTVFLSAGTHGNEYEGQVALREFARSLSAEQVHGRLFILPSLNYPAVKDDARVSPLDNGNLNRVFPGSPDAGPTEAIAGFVSEVLLPKCDAGLDIHTGGNMANFVPMTFVCKCDDVAIMENNLAMANDFNASWLYFVDWPGGITGLDGCAHSLGVPFISTELGGGARLDPAMLHYARRGVSRLLQGLGVIEKTSEFVDDSASMRYLASLEDGRVMITKPGFLERVKALGAEVNEGEVLALIHPVDDAFEAPHAVLSPMHGVVMNVRTTARVAPGDIVAEIAQEVSDTYWGSA